MRRAGDLIRGAATPREGDASRRARGAREPAVVEGGVEPVEAGEAGEAAAEAEAVLEAVLGVHCILEEAVCEGERCRPPAAREMAVRNERRGGCGGARSVAPGSGARSSAGAGSGADAGLEAGSNAAPWTCVRGELVTASDPDPDPLQEEG